VFSRRWRRQPAAAVMGRVLVFLAGWASVVLSESVAYLWAANDFWLRVHVVGRHYGTIDSISRWGLNTDPRTIPLAVFAPLTWWSGRVSWGDVNADQAYHGLIFCLALGAVLIGALVVASRRQSFNDRSVAGLIVAAVWFAWPLLAHQFGSQSLTQFVPMHRLSRHLVLYAPGAVFATVAGWSVIVRATSSSRFAYVRPALTMAAWAIVVFHFYVNWRGEQIAYAGYHRIKDTYSRVRAHLPAGVATIIADPGDLCFFDFWLNPLGVERVRMVAFANYSRCDELKTGVVLTQSNPGWERLNAPVIQQTVARLPCLLQPPAQWRLVYDGEPEKLYRIQ
jgi:hypothetical protein